MEEELAKFLKEYKAKLASERLELLTLSTRVSAKSTSKQEAVPEQVPDETSANGIPATRDGGEHNQPSASLFESGSVTHDERMERRRRQREYRRCLDEQIAQKQQRKEQECSYSCRDAPAREDSPARSASPPIRCHYRRPAQRVSLPPARPLTAGQSEFCLNDLTELRRSYAHPR